MKEVNIQCDDNLIYHYTSADTAIKYILFNKELRLSPFINTNDPKESKFPGIPWTPSPDHEGNINKREKIKSMFECYTKVVCFSQDKIVENEIIKGYNCPTMWAHYGDCHKGVCLIFKKDVILKQLQKVISKQNIYHNSVKYCNDISTYIEKVRCFTQDDFKASTAEKIYTEYSENIFQKVTPFFSIKRLDWVSESEYRFIINEYKAGYTYFNFGDALHEIILGINIKNYSKEYIDLVEYAKSYNVKVSKIHWDFGMGIRIGIDTQDRGDDFRGI